MKLHDLLLVLLDKLERWARTLVAMLPNLVVAVLVVALFVLVGRLAARTVRGISHRLTGNTPISDLFGHLARIAVVLVGVLVALGLLDLDKTVTSVLAGVGVVGLALGFAFQDIAANLMSGILMAVRRPFDVGDLVEIAGKLGHIERLELRATVIRTLDGLSVIVPNKDVFQAAIINYTSTPQRRMDLSVGVAYHTDLERALEVVRDACRAIPRADAARAPEAYFEAFGESSIDMTVRVWLDDAEQTTFLAARSAAVIAIKRAFDAEGISIPFPIRTLDFGADVVGVVRADAMRMVVGAPQPDGDGARSPHSSG